MKYVQTFPAVQVISKAIWGARCDELSTNYVFSWGIAALGTRGGTPLATNVHSSVTNVHSSAIV